MKFKHRLAYYLFGALIGCMFLFMFLDKKDAEFCYLPNCRVLKNIRNKPFTMSEEAKQKLEENWVTMDDIKKCTEHGDVDFSRSKTLYKGGKIYVIEGRNANNEPIEIEVVNFENKVLLKDIKKL
ncbi:DUF4258 domain-containing protein [Flavobacterium alkalisoli]|uniref:DUF4258 domain-containing protein n=1 Tax=Flavobacterium alkalisoli TaxID=2602769 RepID=A0A5B9FV12_9FLAO|nr:DUF4258 domain-containing protein [Flavobacterium alkalisoli]QEE50754.1 DUF4258 domain-containing protein [Flavobacterium alkalisoli]